MRESKSEQECRPIDISYRKDSQNREWQVGGSAMIRAGKIRRRELEFTKGVLEARVGIEPTHKGFADLSLTTWVPRRSQKRTFKAGLL
jgi:hypothetical protein